MSDAGVKVIKNIVIVTLVVTGLIGLGFYFFYGIEIAIISIFSALLVFTVIHLVLFFLWLNRKSE
ncbi:MAG: hypothetical protein OEY78_10150 [Gammaproteobacteria bacterium]|nr:hypothetical protein [Gammaproteobacteria bacterium]